MIRGLLDKGAVPVLERVIQFTAERHRLLSDSIANISTPYFKPKDLSTDSFQSTLRTAIEQRRTRKNPIAGPLEVPGTREVRFKDGLIQIRPSFTNENIMFHDRNNRSLEHIMQDLAENTMAHKAGIEMLRNEFDMLRTAIRERV